MEAILDQVKQLAATSEEARQEVMVALRNLAFSFESPQDTIHRYGHMVCPYSVL